MAGQVLVVLREALTAGEIAVNLRMIPPYEGLTGNFPLLLTLHEDVPISKVNQLSFPAGKKCNRCPFRFGLVVIYQSGHA